LQSDLKNQSVPYILKFSELGLKDIPSVGGKNASLGELINHLTQSHVPVPDGFAITSKAFLDFMKENNLNEEIEKKLTGLDIENIDQLTQTGKDIRKLISTATLPRQLNSLIEEAYKALSVQTHNEKSSFAVRSSATAEDLPEASFAGQQESYLNISGIENILNAVKKVYASLYTDRAIAYRVHHNFSHSEVAISVGVQHMVCADQASSGVMFSIDTESGFKDVVFITSAYGLGEMVVQGAVNPDEFYVSKNNIQIGKPSILRRRLGSKAQKLIYAQTNSPSKSVETVDVDVDIANKFSITDSEVEELAKFAIDIEEHYGKPMDIEWAKDAKTGKLYILQARPETVKSKLSKHVISHYKINQKNKTLLVQGRAIGQKIGQGVAKVINSVDEISQVNTGDVLITDMTDPNWEPIMKRASAIVTNRGGRTCHAAIIAREMGIPALVGCGQATEKIKTGSKVTVSCAEGHTGYVYDGLIEFSVNEVNIDKMPNIPFKIMMNIANPDLAFASSMLPSHGVGLARLEFIINNMIGIHPSALIQFDSLKDPLKSKIASAVSAYSSPVEFYIQKLTEGIAMLACAFADKPVIVRLSDFKSNEYANLLGGDLFEPTEENPMLGFRGASRYVAPSFIECFALECEAIKRVRNDMGFENVQIMIPFVRTTKEAHAVIEQLKQNGLVRGENKLKIIMMCELPTNAILAEEFLEYFDGFSIGSNDLTQLTLGLDRDSGLVSEQFDERDDAVKKLMQQAIQTCKKHDKYVGICGQGPSDHQDLAQWLIEQGIESVSLNPDTVLETWLYLAKNMQKEESSDKSSVFYNSTLIASGRSMSGAGVGGTGTVEFI